jgi:hypothetical protein
VWRSNIAVDRKLPWGIVSTSELLYAKDVNGIYYINANLPPRSRRSAASMRDPRWLGTPCVLEATSADVPRASTPSPETWCR